MDRSKYHDGVEVTKDHLEYTESTKIQAIKRLVTILATTGPAEGLVLTPDTTDAYKVMITQGKGWTYGGEFIEVVADITGIVVSNLIGVESYVALKAVEVDGLNLPHVVTGTMYPTKVTMSYIVEVLTKTQWTAISDKSMYLLAGIVTGSGSVVRGIDITRPATTNVALLSVYKQPAALTGVVVSIISSNTSLGTAYIRWNYTNKTLEWRAPGSVSYGLPIEVGISGVYKLWDALALNYVKLTVDSPSLPTEDVTDTVTVIDILAQIELSVGTMKDMLHRGLLGSGMPSPTNPHGLSLDDLDAGEQQDMLKHRLYEHNPGILGDPGSSSAAPSIYSATQVRVNPVVPGEYLVSAGKVYNQLADVFVTISGGVGTYYVYLAEGGNIAASLTAPSSSYFVVATAVWDGAAITSLTDKRVWGSVSPENKVHADSQMVLDPTVVTAIYSLSESLGLIRGLIKKVIGGTNWDSIPSYSVIGLISYVQTVEADFNTHEATTILTGIPHGIQQGHGFEFNADMVDSYHWNDIKSYVDDTLGASSNLGRISYIGGEYKDSVNDTVGAALAITYGAVTKYVPSSDVPGGVGCGCTCTGTCGCTCTCTGTCTCTCKGTSIN